MQQFLSSLSRRARAGFAMGAFVIVALGAATAWWVSHPDYGMLYRDLKDADAAEIAAALGQMQVPYRITDGGHSIMVPDSVVYDTRMKLVSQGVPKGGSAGFELFKDSDYGVTEFAQHVNFQRALQGELERTIDSMNEISSSRVHLTIRRQDLFAREGDTSKASVTLVIKPDKHLDARQVVGVQRLIASAVEGLSPDAVVILDGNGTVLSARGGDGIGLAISDRMDEQARLELQLRQKVGELLHRVMASDDFTISVGVRLNYDHVKQVREQLIPQGKDGNGLVLREKTGSTGRTVDDSDPDHARQGASSNDREVEYAHGREQQEIVQAAGRIERISVGIVVPEAIPQSELSKLSEVVSAGLGLEASRGDKVDIASLAPPITTKVERQATMVVANPSVSAGHSDPKESDESADVPTAALISRLPGWIYLALGSVALLGLSFWMIAGLRQGPKRLTASEREEALQRLRHWVSIPEVKL
jgi:flagellar M-ring protein FliF